MHSLAGITAPSVWRKTSPRSSESSEPQGDGSPASELFADAARVQTGRDATVAPAGAGREGAPTAQTMQLINQLAVCTTPQIALGAEHSAQGVLSTVGIAYLAHLPQARVRVLSALAPQPRLDEEFFCASTDDALSLRVWRGFMRTMQTGCPRLKAGRCRLSCANKCTYNVALIGAHPAFEMPEALHAYMRAGFSWGRAMLSMLGEPELSVAFDMAQEMSQECERARQFIRFSHMSDGTYFATYKPKGDVLPLVAGHFRKRMTGERFAMLDVLSGKLVLCSEGKLALVALDARHVEELERAGKLDPDERFVRALWKRFYDAVTLPHRDASQRGYDLRGHFMPKRLWTYLPELDPTTDTSWSYVPEVYRGSAHADALLP